MDYQKDFVDGALGFPKAVELEKGIYNKVNEYLKEGNKVVFTYDTHFEDYLETREGRNLPVVHCIDETDGHKLFGTLREFEGVENTIHIKKRSFGLSPQDMIEISNKVGEVEEIEILGVVTNICVVSNVVTFQSQYVNSTIVVDAKLCASFDDDMHNKTLDVIESFQGKIINRR